MSADTAAKLLCNQCSEECSAEDLKPVYDEELEICGHICNPCRIKSVELARRCQIVDCRTRPDSGPTGFRTLPSKFYDLPEGEVKKRIIKQFGIIKNTRACCNMCYVRISKAIVQVKIVYGDGLPRQAGKTSSPNKTGKHAVLSSTQNATNDSTKAPQVKDKDDRLAEYTGPKFTRRSGQPSWDKTKIQATATKVTPTNISELNSQVSDDKANKTSDNSESVSDEKNALRDTKVDTGQATNANFDEKFTNSQSLDETKEQKFDESVSTTKDAVEQSVRPNNVDSKQDGLATSKGENKTDNNISYSSTPISPTSMRFRRIVPKMPKFEGFELSDDSIDLEEDVSPPGSRGGRKRSRGEDDDDETWSPGKSKKDKIGGKFQKKAVSSDVMSDFVSCTGCRKICSNKETKAVYDEKKGCTRKLCAECRHEKEEQSKKCHIKTCTTPISEMVLKPLPPKIHEITGRAKEQLDAIGVTKETDVCCMRCLKTITDIVAMEIKDKDDDGNEQVFTMCRNCCKIIPMKDTFPNITEEGRKCGVLCQPCSGKAPPVQNETDPKKDAKTGKKIRVYDTTKTLGFCKAKGCIHVGETDPVQLVSGKRILRNYLDEKFLRNEFDLDDDDDYCCRSCHARIKWFVADIKKKEQGIGTEGKGGNSLKNLTPRLTEEKKKVKEEVMEIKEIKSEQKLKASPKIRRRSKLGASSAVVESETPSGRTSADFINKGKQVASPITTPFSNLSSPSTIIIPPSSSTTPTTPSGHPPVLQVGGQQFVLNVISRCEKESQTEEHFGSNFSKGGAICSEKGVQANIPLMPKFEGTVPANLPNGKKVKYADAKEKTKYAVKRAGKDLFDQFLQQLDDISGGCAQQLLADIYRPKDAAMATNYEKILMSIGMLYRNTEKANRQERLRLLSTVALHAPNETLKRFFQRKSKKGDMISVNEAEIVQAREYAKQFGPGTHVIPVGQISWNELVASGKIEATGDSSMNIGAEKTNKETDQTTSSLESDMNANEKRDGMLVQGENFRSVEGDKSETDRAGNESQIVANDGSKKVVTLEKMKAEGGKLEAAENRSTEGQLVTFKVTVRNAQDGTAIRKGDGVTDGPKGARNGANGLKDGAKVMKDAPKGVTEGITGAADTKKDLVEPKATETKPVPLKRKRRRLNNPDGKNSKDGGQVRKRKRTSLGTDAAEKGKKKTAGGKPGDKDIPGEKREKRSRTAFSNERKMILEGYFEKSIYVSKKVVEEISKELGIDKKRIENWFRNRRSKLKKDEGGKLKNNDENLSKKESVEKSDTEKGKGSAEKGDSEERNTPEVDSSSGLSSEEGSTMEGSTMERGAPSEGSTIENSPINVTEPSHEIPSLEVKLERRNVDGSSGLAEKSSSVITTETSDKSKNENENNLGAIEGKTINRTVTKVTENKSDPPTSNRIVTESETKHDLNKGVNNDISITTVASTSSEISSRIDEPPSDQMNFKLTKAEESTSEEIGKKQLEGRKGDSEMESPMVQEVLCKNEEKVDERAESRPNDKIESVDKQCSMDERITKPVPNRPLSIDLVKKGEKDRTNENKTEKPSDELMKINAGEYKDIYNGVSENLNNQLPTATKVNGVISRGEKQNRMNEAVSQDPPDRISGTNTLKMNEKEGRAYENTADYYSDTTNDVNSLKTYEKQDRVYETTSDYPSKLTTYSKTDEYRKPTHDSHGEELQYTEVGYEDVSSGQEKSRDAIVVQSPEVKTPIFFPPTPIWEDIPVFKNSKQTGPYSIISPELSHSYSREVSIDDNEDNPARVRPRIWSSEEEQATYALTEIENYEMEEGDVESKVQEDLVIALNNDPDFMKDLNELMDIAKT